MSTVTHKNGQGTEPVGLGGDVSNAGADTILADAPYSVAVTVMGVSAILWHRWQSDSIEAKANAAKGSTAKKTDDLESYVWRDEEGYLSLPGEYLRGSLINPQNGAAKYQQDPRSTRKSALDLFKASIISLTDVARIYRADGTPTKEWDYVDKRRVTVQRQGVTRHRPALRSGWSATVVLMCQSPAYIPPEKLLATLNDAGRLVGVADFRPTFGRYQVTGFQVLRDDEIVAG